VTGRVARVPVDVRGRYLVLDAVASPEPGVERFTAYDPELARRVQLCVVAIADDQQRARVMARARGLAGMTHRNVAAVLDIGASEDGIHIATELADGPPLRAWCSTQGLDARATWRSIAAAGRGLAAAHAAGIVHGALDPDRIRIGSDGRVCVVDFAIAPSDEATIADDVRRFATIAADVLAARDAPGWWLRPLQAAARGEPCEIAVLLARVEAHEWRRRQLWLGLGTVAVAAALVYTTASDSTDVACTGAARHLDGVWDDARREQWAAAFTATGAPWAGDVERLARERLDAHAAAWIEQHEDACRSTRIDHAQSDAVLELRMACLQRRRLELAALVDTIVAAEPTVLARADDVAAGLTDLQGCADVDALISRTPPVDPGMADGIASGLASARALRDAGEDGRALAIASPWVAAAHTLGDAVLLAQGQLLLADLEDRLGAPEVAERTLLAALWSAERAHADHEVAQAWIELEWLLGFRRGDRSEGERAAQHAARALQRVGGDASLEAMRLGNLGYVLEIAGDYDAAAASFEASLALAEQTFGRDDPRLLQPLNGLAMTLKNQGSYERAAATFERALDLVERTVGPDHPRNASLLANLGNLQRARGQLAESEASHRRALEIRRATLGEDHPEVAASLHNLASLQIDRGDYEGAAASFRRAAEVFEASYGDRHGHVGTARNGLGYALYLQQRFGEARTEFDRAIAIQSAAHGEDHPMVASARTNLGLALHMLGDLDGAAEQHRRSLAIMEAKLGKDHPNLVTALTNLGEVLLARDDAAGALPLLERSVAIAETTEAANAGLASATLGRTYLALGRRAEGIAALERAIAIMTKNGSDPERLQDVRDELESLNRRASPSRD